MMGFFSGAMKKAAISYVKDQLQAVGEFLFIAAAIGELPTDRAGIVRLVKKAFEFALVHGDPDEADVRAALAE
jgi:hypothetical protein